MQDKQTLIMAIDDSGKLSKKEKYACFGGIIFHNIKERDKFITQYKQIVQEYKCRYCHHKDNCNFKCPELKHNNLKQAHKRRFLNYIKKYPLLSCTIDNSKIYERIFKDHQAQGRYLDYAIKLMIKEAIKKMIKEKIINPYKDLEIILNIDENSYKSNGYYNLEESIYMELKQGMNNVRNYTYFHNLIYGNLMVKVYFRKSYLNYLIQGADLVAGTVRKYYIQDKASNLTFINYQIYLPKSY